MVPSVLHFVDLVDWDSGLKTGNGMRKIDTGMLLKMHCPIASSFHFAIGLFLLTEFANYFYQVMER